MKRYLAAAVIVGSIGFAKMVTAATQTTNFTVTANVGVTCTIAVPSGTLAFGNYDPTSPSPLNGTTNLTLTCTSGAPVTVALDQGLHDTTGTPDIPVRAMSDGAAQRLNYFLYQDVGLTQVWGANTTVMNQTGTGALVTIPIYGQVPATQTETAAIFTDTVVATVTF